jgi:pyruvate-ferredoxin/flavodoxin oxidoreductase
VRSGYWPLYRFHPSEAEGGKPFKLDSGKPSIPIAEFVANETRFAVLQRTNPERAAELATLAQADADGRWRYYEQLAGIERTVPHLVHLDPVGPAPAGSGNGNGSVPPPNSTVSAARQGGAGQEDEGEA